MTAIYTKPAQFKKGDKVILLDARVAFDCLSRASENIIKSKLLNISLTISALDHMHFIAEEFPGYILTLAGFRHAKQTFKMRDYKGRPRNAKAAYMPRNVKIDHLDEDEWLF